MSEVCKVITQIAELIKNKEALIEAGSYLEKQFKLQEDEIAKRAQLQDLFRELSAKERDIEGREKSISAKESELKDSLVAFSAAAKSHENECLNAAAGIEEQKKFLREKEDFLTKKSFALDAKENDLSARELMLQAKENQLRAKEEDVVAKEFRVNRILSAANG
jgi:hypothetical protein